MVGRSILPTTRRYCPTLPTHKSSLIEYFSPRCAVRMREGTKKPFTYLSAHLFSKRAQSKNFIAAILLIGLLGALNLISGQQRGTLGFTANTALQRQEWFYNQRAFPHGDIPANARLHALAELDRMLNNPRNRVLNALSGPASRLQWALIGPNPIGTPFWLSPVAGQVSAIAIDPRNGQVAYIGTAAGGVWKTTNGGGNWVALTDDQPSLSIGSLVLDPSSPDTVYAGTGGPFGAYGAGILKSINAGATWQSIPGPFAGPFGSDNFFGGGAKILSLAVHPTNGQIVVAAVWRWPQNQGGIFRSADAGATWTQMLPGPGHYVQFDSGNPNTAYVALGSGYGDPSSGLYKSVDAGLSWTALGQGGARPLPPAINIGEITMAAAPSNFNTLFAYIDNPAFPSVPLLPNLPGVFKSTDGGSNWTQISVPPTCCNPILIHPSDENVIFGGGTFPSSIFRSVNGGTSWTDISGVPNFQQTPHADAHSLALSSDAATLYFGNDGGIYKTTNVVDTPVTWSSLNTTLATALFYPGLSIHPTDINFSLGGTQDNGTLNYNGALLWNQVTCGDGGPTAIDFLTPSTMYATCEKISVQKSTMSGVLGSWTPSITGINTADRVSFIPPLVMDPSNPQKLYFGTYRIYQTNNGASNWTAISPDLTGGPSHTITAIAVATNSNTVYAGTDDSHVQVTTNATAGAGAAWTDRSAGLPQRYITHIAVDANNSLIAYVTTSGFSGFGDTQGHVFKTTTGGVAWTDISGNLPNIPANDVVVDPDLANTIYVATDIGVFFTSNAGSTWHTLVNGLPRVVVQSLRLHSPTRTLRAATYGRSVWDIILGPQLTIAKTHAGDFTQGQLGAAYTVTVGNTGAGPTSGIVTVTETAPTGLMLTALSGTGVDVLVGNFELSAFGCIAAKRELSAHYRDG
jgi:photosystem II stability/assembly factor-like uncharacterized protein